jgi:hypothetical protein
LRGEGENLEFHSASPSDGVGLGHWKNLWDLSDALTLELGASYARGPNDVGGATALAGADFTFKWRPPAGGKYHSWIFAGEYLDRRLEQAGAADEHGYGGDVWGLYQFAQRWAAMARFDHLDANGGNAGVNPNALANVTTRKYSAALAFNATEFSSFRLEYDQAEGPLSATGESVERKIYLQGNFTIGAHPAHAY